MLPSRRNKVKRTTTRGTTPTPTPTPAPFSLSRGTGLPPVAGDSFGRGIWGLPMAERLLLERPPSYFDIIRNGFHLEDLVEDDTDEDSYYLRG